MSGNPNQNKARNERAERMSALRDQLRQEYEAKMAQIQEQIEQAERLRQGREIMRLREEAKQIELAYRGMIALGLQAMEAEARRKREANSGCSVMRKSRKSRKNNRKSRKVSRKKDRR
jgi:hypothetical protein